MRAKERRSLVSRRWQGAVLLLLLLSLLGYAAYVAATVQARTRPLVQPPCCETPADYQLPYESVALDSCDETVLAGWYVPGDNGAGIILLHDEEGTRADVLEAAASLAQAGYSVLLYDRRGHGESSPVLRAAGWDDLGDVYNAWDWLAARPEVDEEQIGLYGEGVGGQVALRAAAFSRRIYAVAAQNPAPTTAADRPATGVSALSTLHERLLLQGIAWRSGIPQPFPVVDVIGDVSPQPLLLLGTAATGTLQDAVTQRYYEQAREPKALWSGQGDAQAAATQTHALVRFFDGAQGGGDVAQQ